MPATPRPPRGLALHHVLYAMLALGLVALVLIRLGTDDGGSGNEQAVAPEPAAAPAADPTLMDPAPYRGTIQQIEAILYQAGPAELGDADRVSRLVTQLGTALLRAPNRLQGQRAGREVMAFGNRLGQTTDAGYGTLDLPRARADWLRVRDKLFRPAPWFRKSAN